MGNTMSKKYVIRFHCTAYDDYEVTADNIDHAYDLLKSGEYVNHPLDTGVLYGSENKFHVIYEVGEDGQWLDVIKQPLVKEDNSALLKKVVQQIKTDEAMEDYTAIEELLSDVPKEKLLGFLKEDSDE
jgi:hypothetical protein